MTQTFEFPTVPAGSRAEIEASYLRIEHRLADDPIYHFAIVVPRDWKVVDEPSVMPTPEQPIGTIGRLRSISGAPGAIDVVSLLLTREMNPSDWLEGFAPSSGFEIVERRAVPSAYGMLGDVLAVAGADGDVVARMFAMKDGNRLYCAVCRAGAEAYPALAEAFLLAVQGFSLLAPTREPYAEPMRDIDGMRPLDAAITVPGSWLLEPEEAPADGTALKLKNMRGEALLGQINVLLLPRHLEQSAEGLRNSYLESLAGAGIAVEDAPLVPARTVPAGLEAGWEARHAGSLHGVPVDIRLSMVRDARGWGLITVLGPVFAADPEACAVNLRAYQIVVGSLRC